MDKFLMICTVAADFGPFRGEMFQVKSKDIGLMISAPAWIKDTLLYKMLLADGSIKVGESAAQVKKLESDPLEGTGADGKASEPKEEAPKATRKTRAKKGEAQ